MDSFYSAEMSVVSKFFRHSRVGWNPESQKYRWPQVIPVRVLLFDELQLPSAVPFLDLLFASNRSSHVFVRFEKNQEMDSVLFGEPFDHIILVLPNSFRKIAGYADVKRSIAFTGQDIDRRLFRYVSGDTGFPPARE